MTAFYIVAGSFIWALMLQLDKTTSEVVRLQVIVGGIAVLFFMYAIFSYAAQ